jgi:hypothetical protein
MKVFVEVRYLFFHKLSGGLDICFDGNKEFEVVFEESQVTTKLLIQRLK